MKKFIFKLKNGNTKTMGFDEFVRWACLIEALEVVGGKVDKMDLKVEATLGNL